MDKSKAVDTVGNHKHLVDIIISGVSVWKKIIGSDVFLFLFSAKETKLLVTDF